MLRNLKAKASEADKGDPFEKALDFEASIVVMRELMVRRALWVAGIAIGVAVLLAIALAMLAPLKTVVPYVVRVDSDTGHAAVLTELNTQQLSQDQALDKYWLARYVIHRESYDYKLIQNDYDSTLLMSSDAVGRDYAALYQGDDALDARFGSRVLQKVTIDSIVLSHRNGDVGTVRFSKRSTSSDGGMKGTVSHWVATIAYRYNNPAQLSATDRLKNPLGFQVTSYRIDPEF
ncbi:virB8 family protein [Dongshaea marina]|uniref:virB8 family protein n=1 Tax=Dongshaea marina TaxID=2047966 RepID=UPI000D3EAEB8|nr:type IV secretion system protein [Dongshaea marina]